MKFLPIVLFLSAFLKFFFQKSNNSEIRKGVYIFSTEYKFENKSFKFPDDSVFIDNEFAIEKVIRIDETEFFGATSIKQSLDRYNFIDFKKGLYKNIEKNLDPDFENIPWEDISKKKFAIDFSAKWENSEIYKTKDTIYEGIKVKKIEYTSITNEKYEIYLQPNLSKTQDFVFYKGIEDKYNGEVLKMVVTYPNHKETSTTTKKFIPIKNHEVLNALEKLILKAKQ